MAYPLYRELDFSNKQRVFTVGDIHGEFRKLDKALEEVGFDPILDVLISLGDLVDRGPFSNEFEYYLDKPWFYRILGNHDLQPREYLLGYESAEAVSGNGGDWFLNKPDQEKERLATVLEAAPIALMVTTPHGNRVGVAHADMHTRWDHLSQQCQDPDLERYLVNLLTGSRDTIRSIQDDPDLDLKQVRVNGVDHVFHGHTPTDHPFTFANRTWIDTDKGPDGGQLTLVDVDEWLQHL